MNQYTQQQLDQAAERAAMAAADLAAAKVRKQADGEIAATKNKAAKRERTASHEVRDQMAAINTALTKLGQAANLLYTEIKPFVPDEVAWLEPEQPEQPDSVTAQYIHAVCANITTISSQIGYAAGVFQHLAGEVQNMRDLLERAQEQLKAGSTAVEDAEKMVEQANEETRRAMNNAKEVRKRCAALQEELDKIKGASPQDA